MRIRTALVAVLAAVTVAAAGCTADPAEPSAPDVIRLGALVPLSGRNSPSGEAMVDAAQMAVREANEAGGVLGRQVELVVGDDACDPGTAVAAANDLVTRDIVVSVGGYCSSATVPTLRVFRDANIPMIIPLSNSTDLLEPGYDSVFLLPGTVEDEAVFAVQSMPRLGGHRLAVVHDGTSFPLTLAQSTAAVARRAGSPVTLAAELELSQGAPSYARVAEAVVSAGADVVYFTGYYAEGNRLIVDLRRLGFAGPILVGDGAADGPLLENLTPEQHVDVYGTQLLVPDFMPEIADWAKRFEAMVGSPPGLCTVEAYDAVTLALDAIRRAGTVERGAVRAAIAGTTELDLLSGPARFNANGTRTNPKFLLLRVREGGFDAVSPAPSQ